MFYPKKSLAVKPTRCVWSNKRCDHIVKVLFQANNRLEKTYFVKSEYKRPLISFLKTVEKLRNYLISFAIVLLFLAFLALIKPVILPFFYLALAVYLIAIPFLIPSIVRFFGIRYSVLLFRLIAIVAVLSVLLHTF